MEGEEKVRGVVGALVFMAGSIGGMAGIAEEGLMPRRV